MGSEYLYKGNSFDFVYPDTVIENSEYYKPLVYTPYFKEDPWTEPWEIKDAFNTKGKPINTIKPGTKPSFNNLFNTTEDTNYRIIRTDDELIIKRLDSTGIWEDVLTLNKAEFLAEIVPTRVIVAIAGGGGGGAGGDWTEPSGGGGGGAYWCGILNVKDYIPEIAVGSAGAGGGGNKSGGHGGSTIIAISSYNIICEGGDGGGSGGGAGVGGKINTTDSVNGVYWTLGSRNGGDGGRKKTAGQDVEELILKATNKIADQTGVNIFTQSKKDGGKRDNMVWCGGGGGASMLAPGGIPGDGVWNDNPRDGGNAQGVASGGGAGSDGCFSNTCGGHGGAGFLAIYY